MADKKVPTSVQPEKKKNVLDKLQEISYANDWNIVRWHTEEHNVTANKLYDQGATKTIKEVYELK